MSSNDLKAQKEFANLQARFAFHGHTLDVQHREGQPLYIVGRWGQSRTFSHLGDVDAFLRQIGGAA